jgi:hypothetical protein
MQSGNYVLNARFDGRTPEYEATSDLTTFVVEKEDTVLKLSKRGKGKKKRLVVRLTDADDPVRGVGAAAIIFRTKYGHPLGTAITDGTGKAVFKLHRHYWSKRVLRAKFDASSDVYWESSRARINGRGVWGG